MRRTDRFLFHGVLAFVSSLYGLLETGGFLRGPLLLTRLVGGRLILGILSFLRDFLLIQSFNLLPQGVVNLVGASMCGVNGLMRDAFEILRIFLC